MTVEAGGTCGICYGDAMTADYLWERIRGKYPDKAGRGRGLPEVVTDPDAVYKEASVHDVSRLAPVTTFGQKPDNVRPVREMEGTRIKQVFIGSCTNGRMDDLAAPPAFSPAARSTPACAGSSARPQPRSFPRPWRKG